MREYLEKEGKKLASTPADKSSYYYEVRDRFNKEHNPLDFLFLQRSNFNGMIRFSKNGYNVPFGRKPNRFRPALITKIVNQVEKIQEKGYLSTGIDGCRHLSLKCGRCFFTQTDNQFLKRKILNFKNKLATGLK